MLSTAGVKYWQNKSIVSGVCSLCCRLFSAFVDGSGVRLRFSLGLEGRGKYPTWRIER